jgi:2-polyprenyl-3-methyl-5-hydroxy-6-metoxy-1,4-benzoquinol methylase
MPTFTDREAQAAWDAGAESYDTFIESGMDSYRLEVHGPGLLAACGPVAGCRVLDLGCGQGYFSRELARQGARVTGVDLSEAQIALAQRHEVRESLGIEYRAMSASAVGENWQEGSFDRVTACMSLQDMASVEAVFASVAAVLRPGGRFLFSIPHPGTDTPFREWERDWKGGKKALKIDRYFETGPAICKWNMRGLSYPWDTPYERRTLAQWSALLASAGFLLRRLHEPRPTEEQVRRKPDLSDSHRLPYFLVFDLISAQP